MVRWVWLVLACISSATWTGSAQHQSAHLGELARCLTGSFSSAEQARLDTSYFDIRLHVVPVWPLRTDGFWLYVEQAMAGREQKPYRQRVYHLTQTGDSTFQSAVFLLPGPERFIGAWKTGAPLGALTPDSLVPRTGCAILLRRTGPFRFAGSTDGRLCPSELRGAAHATSEAVIAESVMVSWDRGFDAAGNQVWGAAAGGYVFKKLSEPAPE
jgi:hypothetical protein